jgi:hypothetical protein
MDSHRPAQLLVSVGNDREARTALAGGADLIDAKDPTSGALAPVSIDTFVRIHHVVDGQRPVTAALGDAGDQAAVRALAGRFAHAGAAFVKVGFAGVTDPERIRALLKATREGAGGGSAPTRVVAVAYADHQRGATCSPCQILAAAIDARVDGFLVDTFDKDGPGLTAHVAPSEYHGWVRTAHRSGLFVALAGKVTASDMKSLGGSGADIVGVRGAACDQGRNGAVVESRVVELRALLHTPVPEAKTAVRVAANAVEFIPPAK